MKIIVTSGPSHEPLDAVRRLTNFSTGELGTLLSETLAAAGHEVTCYRSGTATHPAPGPSVKTISFSTNGDLEEQWHRLKKREQVGAVFHLAALCDFRVRELRDEQGRLLARDKVSSRAGLVQITLEPLPKLLPRLRSFFPASQIIGWKYEQHGPRQEVIAQGRRQMQESRTDLGVVNGPGYGRGFGVLAPNRPDVHLETKKELAVFLTEWLDQKPHLVKPAPESFDPLPSLLPLAPFL